MIYYFSGTGNTRWIAEQMGQLCGLPVRRITDCVSEAEVVATEQGDKQVLGMAFPIYGWTLPAVAMDFIRRLPRAEEGKSYYVFALLSCGDDIGRTNLYLAKLLAEKGYRLDAVWSFSMPNTYIALPFFDVDSEELVKQKVEATRLKLVQAAKVVQVRKSGVVDVVPGAFARLKSGFLRWFFYRFWVGAHLFATNERCTACKRCEKACPMHNVKVEQAKIGPKWGEHCTFCLACYHVCPESNIHVRPAGANKGRHTQFLDTYI